MFKKIVFLSNFWLFVFVVNVHQSYGTLRFVEPLKIKDEPRLNEWVLPSGNRMPMIGFGTSRIQGVEVVRNTLDDALAAGYRLFDTAAVYGNEEEIGKALKELLPKHNLTRKDIFITSKLAARAEDFGENAYAALQKSVKTIDCNYLDLYLIHFPGILSEDNHKPQKNFSNIRDTTWQQLVKGVKNNLTRNIGVSNYNVKHLTELVNNDHGVKVAVNQVEWHPHYHPRDVLELCKKNGILLQAYSSLGGTGNPNLLNNTEVKKIADRLKKHPAQVLLRWALQQGIAVIPKSKSRQHMESNLNLDFELSQNDMSILYSFPQQVKYRWNPDDII